VEGGSKALSRVEEGKIRHVQEYNKEKLWGDVKDLRRLRLEIRLRAAKEKTKQDTGENTGEGKEKKVSRFVEPRGRKKEI